VELVHYGFSKKEPLPEQAGSKVTSAALVPSSAPVASVAASRGVPAAASALIDGGPESPTIPSIVPVTTIASAQPEKLPAQTAPPPVLPKPLPKKKGIEPLVE